MRSGRAIGGNHPLLDACSATQGEEQAPRSGVPGREPGCKDRGGPSAWVPGRAGRLHMATVGWPEAIDRALFMKQLFSTDLLFSTTRATLDLLQKKTHPHPIYQASDMFHAKAHYITVLFIIYSKKCTHIARDQKNTMLFYRWEIKALIY